MFQIDSWSHGLGGGGVFTPWPKAPDGSSELPTGGIAEPSGGTASAASTGAAAASASNRKTAARSRGISVFPEDLVGWLPPCSAKIPWLPLVPPPGPALFASPREPQFARRVNYLMRPRRGARKETDMGLILLIILLILLFGGGGYGYSRYGYGGGIGIGGVLLVVLVLFLLFGYGRF